MDAPGLALHLLSFALPALGVALLVALAARVLLPGRTRWWPAVLLNFVAGLAVLAAGLWWYGRDGKMATYAALVLVVATCQWATGAGWRR